MVAVREKLIGFIAMHSRLQIKHPHVTRGRASR